MCIWLLVWDRREEPHGRVCQPHVHSQVYGIHLTYNLGCVLWVKARTQELIDRNPHDLWWVDCVPFIPSLIPFLCSTSDGICAVACVG